MFDVLLNIYVFIIKTSQAKLEGDGGALNWKGMH